MATNNSSLNTYEKHHSFSDFYTSHDASHIERQRLRLIDFLSNNSIDEKYAEICKSVLDDIKNNNEDCDFKITAFIADEIATIDDNDLPRYLFHRYRYDVYPSKKILDDYPPYIQIEPTSVCNFRCVFCYQTDSSFNKKNQGHMGKMPIELYKDIIDQIEGNIEFLSLASRGEPLLCDSLPEMLDYSMGKFMNLKLNTNASLLTESLCHSLLQGSVKTLVFSADAAEEPLYSQMRVNGKLEKVLKNIEMFQSIKSKHYGDSSLITRVSGVMFDERQNMSSMTKLWSSLVDQISFVKYNPWENIYNSEPNDVKSACSDLWRRMFVWYDGKVNPCDTDYKSTLCFNSLDSVNTISKIWQSESYNNLRNKHLTEKRNEIEPCRRCMVV